MKREKPTPVLRRITKGGKAMSIFGNIFDFNRDGKTDIFEQAMGLAMLEELEKENDEDESDDL